MPQKTDALILLPALLCDSRLYQGVLEALGPEIPAVIPEIWHHGNLADLARDLLPGLPARFAVVGNSMGGYLALELVRQAPERVTHLALVGTNAHADLPGARGKREQAIRLAKAGKFDMFVDGYVESALCAANRAARGPVVRAMARDLGPDALIDEQTAIMGRRTSEDILGTINVPTAVICGREDAFGTPEAHQALAAAIPGADCHVIDACGHLVPLEAPVELATQVRRLLAL